MKKLSDYYKGDIDEQKIIDSFSHLTSKAINEIEMTETEIYFFLEAYRSNIYGDVPITSDKFEFWGVEINRIK